jgi:hypothetical protein
MRRKSTPDLEIATLAQRQGGVVSRRQLRAIGLSAEFIDRRLQSGRLHRVHAGAYAVGHRVLSADGLRWAAVLACGEGAVVSHWSAAIAWDLCAPRAP